MNRTFKSIWNESTGTFVAVAENTTNKGKKSSSRLTISGGLGKLVGSIALAASVSGMALAVHAATSAPITPTGINFVGNDNKNIATELGGQVKIVGGMPTTGLLSPSIATNIKTVKNDDGNLEIQMARNLTEIDTATVAKKIIIGNGTRGQTIIDENNGLNTKLLNVAGGVFSVQTNGVNNENRFVTVGLNTRINMGGNKVTNMDAGVANNDAVNVGQLNTKVATAVSAAKTHYYSVKSTEQGTGSNYANDGATGTNSLAAGVGAKATKKSAVAVGHNVTAAGESSVALGAGAAARQDGGIAIGGVVVRNPETPGQAAEAIGLDSIAIGSGAVAKAEGAQAAIAIGKQAYAENINSLALGAESRAKDGSAIGTGANAMGGGLAVGMNANTGPGLFGGFLPNNNTALGDETKITKGNYNVALGALAVAGDSDLSALAYRPTTGIAVAGENAVGEVSIGGDSSGQFQGGQVYRRVTNLAAGAADTDAVNVSQLKSISTLVEANKTHYYSVKDGGAPAGNYENDGAEGAYSLAAGVDALAEGESSVAIGHSAKSLKGVADKDGNFGVTGVAIGKDAGTLGGRSSIAIGENAQVRRGLYGDALGDTAGGIAIGQETLSYLGEVFIGTHAGSARDDTKQSSGNIGVGADAGKGSEGDSNIMFGIQAGQNLNGAWNVVTGNGAGIGLVGEENTFSGMYAGSGTKGNWNVGIGSDAGSGAKGSTNVGIGYGAGSGTIGSRNIAIGQNAGQNLGTDSDKINNSITIGRDTKSLVSFGIALGNNSVADTLGGKYGHESAGIDQASKDAIRATRSTTAGLSIGIAGAEGVAAARRQIHNLAAGTIDTDAVNVAQLKSVESIVNQGFNITADNADLADPLATEDNVKLGETVKYTSADGSIVTTVADNEINFALGDNLNVGTPGVDGKDGFIGVNGKDGVSGVAINGADGSIGLTGPAGTDGVSPTLTMRPEIKPGNVIDDVTDVTRLTYNDATGKHTVATLEDDGLRFSGNDNSATLNGYVTRKLNQSMQIFGGKTTAGTYSSANIHTVATQDGGIEIQLADSPKFGSVTINAGNTGKITGVTAGVADTDAVNVSQLTTGLAATKTHYYSVNDGGVVGGNYNNDGATGANALAAGVGASATDTSAVAVGHNVTAKGKNSVAIGSGATAQYHGGIAIGGVATDTSTSTPSTQAAEAKGLDSIALGSGAIADASFGAGANGQASTAIGKTAKALGPNALAVGANSDAKNGTAVGSGAIVRNGGLAVGMGADAGPDSGFFPTSNVALGDDSKVTGGGFNVALGAMAVAGNSDLTAQAYRPVAGNAVAGEFATGEVSIGGVDPFDEDNMIYRRVTNLAAGAADTDAVNVSQLKAVQDFAGQGFNITADNSALAAGETVDNVKLGDTVKYTSADGSIVTTVADNEINFALGDELNVGTVGQDGKDGFIGVNGKDGVSGVAINGADGSIGLTGPAGTDGVSPTLTMRPEIKPGNVIDDVTDVTRLTYNDAAGKSHTVATLEDDGLRFSGNDNPTAGYVTRNLNKEMQIVGSNPLNKTAGTYSSGNIYTVATQDGGIEIQIADAPKFGDVTINNGNTGKITGVTAGVADTDVVNVSQLNAVNTTANKGWNVQTDTVGGKSNVAPDGLVNINGDGKNISVTNVGNDLVVALGDELNVGTVGQDGKDGFIGVNGKDGVSGVAINGANGTIGLTGPMGAAGTIGVVNGVPGVDGKDGITRIVIDDIQVATMKDGLKFAGNTGTTIEKQLNETLNIEGELADLADASGANLRVDSKDGKLKLVMAQDLTDLNSITLNNGGPIISGTGINMGSNVDATGYPINRITNLGKGIAGTDAVNLDQLNAVNDTANKGWNVQTDTVGGKSNVAPDGLVNINGDGKNISVTNVDNDLVVALGDELSVGSKDGKDGFIGVNGKDGVSGVAINGANGTIGLTGPMGAAGTIGVVNGVPGVDGKDGITRIVIDDIQVATMKDGLKFAGNTGTTIEKQLNETLNIEGELADLADASGANLRVDSKDGKLNVVMAKNLTDLDTVLVGSDPSNQTFINGGAISSNTLNVGGGRFIVEGNNVSVALGTNVSMGGNQVHNVVAGTAGTDAVNLDQLNAVNETANKGWNITTNGDPLSKENVAPDATVDFNNTDGNIVIGQVGTNLEFNLNKDIDLGDDGSVTTGNSVLNNAGLAVDDGAGNSTKVTTGGVEIADAAGNTTSIEAGGLTVSDGTNTSTFGPTQIVAGGANEVTIDGVTGRINGLTNKTFDPLSFTSGQAATEDQLKSVSDVANAGWNVTTNGDPLSKENVAPDATVDFNNTDGNIVIGQAGTNLEFNLNKDIDLGATGSVTTGDTVMNDNGVTIAGGPSITKTGIDAGDKKITSVAKGEISETSTDAINGSQLSDSNIRITKNEGDIINNAGDIKNIQNGKEGMFQVSQDYNAPKPKPTGTKSVAGGAGAIASGNNSTAIGNDAKATANNSTSLGNSASASHNNSVALGYGSTTTRDNSVSVGSIGNERQITNVARGEVSATSTDAINGSQLHDFGGVVNQYFNATNKRIDRVDNNARAGIAGAVAAGTLPQSSLPGKSMLTLGGATYRGETALAIGVSRLSDNSRTVIKINGTADSRGHTSIGVGAGWHW